MCDRLEVRHKERSDEKMSLSFFHLKLLISSTVVYNYLEDIGRPKLSKSRSTKQKNPNHDKALVKKSCYEGIWRVSYFPQVALKRAQRAG